MVDCAGCILLCQKILKFYKDRASKLMRHNQLALVMEEYNKKGLIISVIRQMIRELMFDVDRDNRRINNRKQTNKIMQLIN